MKGKIWPPRCAGCGRILSYEQMNDCPRWTPYGNSLDIEPPEEIYAHEVCFDGNKYIQKEAAEAWIPWKGREK